MVRYFLRLSYDGTAYHGWQVQSNADTIQSRINAALSTLLRSPVETVGCGRTDSGVHAKDFFAHFDSADTIREAEKFIRSMNAILPNDIAIKQLIPVFDTAHARFDATQRTYEYHINSMKDPFSQQRACYWPHELNVYAMNAACLDLKTHTSYGCFCKGKEEEQSVECTIHEAHWENKNGMLIFTISANRFLRNMVRALVGTMLEVGEGKLSREDFRKVLQSGNRSEAGFSVPACGLYLIRIDYPFIES